MDTRRTPSTLLRGLGLGRDPALNAMDVSSTPRSPSAERVRFTIDASRSIGVDWELHYGCRFKAPGGEVPGAGRETSMAEIEL